MQVEISDELLSALSDKTGKPKEAYLVQVAQVADALLRSLLDETLSEQVCQVEHIPNTLTQKSLRESERGENLVHCENLEDMWKKLGI
ncbi:MAG: hypothetical protein AB7I41_09455 [Candidatus Sericytochromatia bacterium]